MAIRRRRPLLKVPTLRARCLTQRGSSSTFRSGDEGEDIVTIACLVTKSGEGKKVKMHS